MNSHDMNDLISALNGCLIRTGFATIGLDRVKTAEVLEEWFEWYLRNHKKGGD